MEISSFVAPIRAVIRRIPRGKVSTYARVAEAAGYVRGGARLAVKALQGAGEAAGLPWHRVVAAGGRIATQGEAAFEQRFRLESEGVRFRGKKVDMANFEHHFRPRRRVPPPAR